MDVTDTFLHFQELGSEAYMPQQALEILVPDVFVLLLAAEQIWSFCARHVGTQCCNQCS